jgi:hypothetical protein
MVMSSMLNVVADGADYEPEQPYSFPILRLQDYLPLLSRDYPAS